MGLVCIIGALIIWKFRLDDSSPWTYLVAICLVVIGTIVITLGYDTLVRV